MTRQYSQRDGIHVHRWVNTENQDLADFTNRMGQALRGKGNTYSLGTMTLSVLTETQFRRARERMSRGDQSDIDLPALEEALKEALASQPKSPDISIEGLGFYGNAVRRGKAVRQAKLAFVVSPEDPIINEDVAIVSAVFDGFDMPPPSYANFSPHITLGEVYLDRIIKGHGDNPHTLIPKRVYVPETIAMCGLVAEIVDKNT